MSVATKTIKIDLWHALLEPIKVVQHEALGRTLAFQITSGDQPVDLTETVVSFHATKPLGATLFNSCTVVDAATGKVSYTMTSQTVAEAGALACMLIITASGGAIRTQPFIVTIIASPDYTFAVESSNEFTALTALVGRIVDNTADLADHEARIDAAEGGIDSLDVELASVASGSPAGVYATAAALTAAIPAGNANIYVVTADGNWYYWSGAAWTAGGVYQASSFPEVTDIRIGSNGVSSATAGESVRTQVDSINDAMSNVIKLHENLLVSAHRISNKVYDPTTHVLAPNAICDAFEPITLQPDVTYYVRNVWGHFSPIKASNGTWTLLETSTDRPTNKSFTVSTISTLYLTIHKDYTNTCLLTTDIEGLNHDFTVEKDGSGDFTSLYAAIQYAEQFMDSTVHVGDGVWDVIAELGETYINGVNAARINRGIWLKNRIHLIFSSNSKVVCNYTGIRQDTMDWLSGFNAGVYGFTLENINLEGSNIRYTMHDERDSDTDAYKNSYINCRMKLDNSMKVGGGATNCIGGGLGLDGYILIEGCIFETVPTDAYPVTPPIVSYHNSAGANGKSHITIKNSHISGDSRIRLNWYGLSTDVSQCEISGCSMGSAILSQAETSDGSSPNVNMAITEWNNIVRV